MERRRRLSSCPELSHKRHLFFRQTVCNLPHRHLRARGSVDCTYNAETAQNHPTQGPPANPRHRARSVKFGDHPRYCLDSHRENVWRCIPAARWGSGTGSVAPAPDRAHRGKLVTFLRLTHTQDPAVPCLENPRVGGSIPPQATKYGSPAT